MLTSRKERQESGLFVADGTKLLKEAVDHWQGLETVILSDGVEAKLPESVRCVRVPEEIMQWVSPMQTPQGALFICRLPDSTAFAAKPGMLLLDGIQDPGNLGTILRTANALQIPVALLEGCADPYNHKTVRASMGAVFRSIPAVTTWQEAKEACRKAGIPVAVTALSDASVDLRSSPVGDMAVVIGSEGQGVRQQIIDEADKQLIIPMDPGCESLNAAIAAAIVMWQMTKL